MNTIDIFDLKIPTKILYTRPSETKYRTKEIEFLHRKELKPVGITEDNILVDGFIQVLLAHNYGIQYIPYELYFTNHKIKRYADFNVFMSAYQSDDDSAKFKLLYEDNVPGVYSVSASEYMDKKCNVDIIPSKRDIILKKQNYVCYICGREMDYSSTYKDGVVNPNAITLDHILPVALGGSSSISNLAFCCNRCNALKGTLMYSEELKQLIIKQRDYEEKIGIYNINKRIVE